MGLRTGAIGLGKLGDDLALASVGAALMILAVPPLNIWPLGLLAWTPLIVLAANRDSVRAGLVGWLQGILGQTYVLASVPGGLRNVGGASVAWSVALGVVLVVVDGGRYGAIAFLTAQALKKGWRPIFVFPSVLVTVEWLYPMFFPWTTCLFFQAMPVLLQGADIAGILTLSLWAGLLHAAFATAWLGRKRGRMLVRYGAVVPALTLVLVFAYGVLRARAVDARVAAAPALRVGIVQGNVPSTSAETSDPTSIYRTTSLDVLKHEKASLLIWPETAIINAVRADRLSTFLSDQVFGAGSDGFPRIEVPILTGIILERGPEESPVHMQQQDVVPNVRRFNSAILAMPSGQVRGVYDKRDLVMFGEYLPFEDSLPWCDDSCPRRGDTPLARRPLPLNWTESGLSQRSVTKTYSEVACARQ